MPRVSPPVNASSAASRLLDSAKSWAEGFDFKSSAARRLEVARTKAPTTGPTNLQRAHALYLAHEKNDRGNVHLLQTTAGTQTLWALHTTTDGDPGYLELFSQSGKLLASGTTTVGRNVVWDETPGAVREKVAPRDISPSVTAFFAAVDESAQPATASGEKLSTGEIKESAKVLVGADLTTGSVDGYESSALYRVLADDAPKLTFGARSFVSRLGELYLDRDPKKLRKLVSDATNASAEVQGRASGPKMSSFVELTRAAWELLPTQVVPATKTEALELLKSLGSTTAEARARVEQLAGEDGLLYTGQVFSQGADWVARPKGQVLFGSSEDGKKIKAHLIPQEIAPPAAPREAIRGLTGVDREVEIRATEQLATGDRFELAWRPARGGTLSARLFVPSNGDAPEVDRVTVPPVLEAVLVDRLKVLLGPTQGPVDVLGWVGRDGGGMPGFVVAHQPEGARGPLVLSDVRIHLGGQDATVTPVVIGAADESLARDLALSVSRHYAQQLVADPQHPELMRLEVALRTGWTSSGDLTRIRDDSAGFNSRTDRFQFQLSPLGDIGVVVTFAKDGTIRLEEH